jgi:ABC-2 type transport system permease protein
VLRWRSELRTLLWARERALGLLLAIPFLLGFSALAALAAYFGLRLLDARRPELLLPLASALVTLAGLVWTFSPLLVGFAFSESHDLSRLMHFPIPRRTLVASSLLANLLQPMALAELPLLVAASLALSPSPGRLPLALAGLAASFVFVVAAAQLAGLLFHGLSRSRRFRDLSLFLGLLLGFGLSLAPILVLSGGARPLLAFARRLVEADVFAWSPFAWGVRAAVYAGRGEIVPALAWSATAGAGILAVLGACALLVDRVYRGELDLGGGAADAGAPRARLWLGGVVGGVLEKDLRCAWRDPGLKASLLVGLVGPLLFLLLFARDGSGGGALPTLAAMIGVSGVGGNAFGFERRGLSLLLSFPAERWRVLLAKNLAAAAFRLPGLLTLSVAGVVLAPLWYLPATLTVAAVCWLAAAGLDNYLSILFPVSAPAPGASPYNTRAAGGRGFGAALLGVALLFAALLLAAPFVFLAWLPALLGRRLLWLVCLPLALAGAAAVYALLVGGAERLLVKREPELLERVLGEA